MSFVDLHAHTDVSDGTLSPRDLVKEAARIGLSAIAVTDHDTVSAIPAALLEGGRLGIEVIAGVEMSTTHEGRTLHILGLFIDHKNPALLSYLNSLRRSKRARVVAMEERLRSLGINLTKNLDLGDGYTMGRPHIGLKLVEQGYCNSVADAFSRYLKKGAPAYVPYEKPSPSSVIDVIHKAGGVAVLAHLNQIGNPVEAARICAYLSTLGLDGVEGWYSEYDDGWQRLCFDLAHKHRLVLSGGSDFHGSVKPGLSLGSGFGSLAVPANILPPLKQRAALIRQRSQ